MSTNNNNNQQSGAAAPSSDQKVLEAVGAMMAALSGLSNSERLKALKMVGGAADLTVRRNDVIAQQAATAASKASKEAAQGTKGAPSKPNPANKKPEVVAAKAALADNAAQLKAAKAANGGEDLPADHPLLKVRRDLEQQLRVFLGKPHPGKTVTGEGSSKEKK